MDENLSYINETIISYNDTYEHVLINEIYIPYISNMYINGIKQDTIITKSILGDKKINDIIYIFNSSLTSCFEMFSECETLISLDVSNFDTSNVTNMSGMFNIGYYNVLLSIKGLNNFNTSNVTDMSRMFYCCNELNSLDLSSFDTTNVTTMQQMFGSSDSLTSITFGNMANVSKVTKYGYMFYEITPNLTLCENTRTSWETLLKKVSPKPSTITYVECSIS